VIQRVRPDVLLFNKPCIARENKATARRIGAKPIDGLVLPHHRSRFARAGSLDVVRDTWVTLIVLRHAKSAWPEGVPDLDRPLGERGSRDAPAAGRWLAGHAPPIDLALCSPARRVRQTWELASAELPDEPPIREEPRIYFGPLIDVVRALDVTTALLVGHNPDLEDLVEVLTGESVPFKTSTIAVLRSEQPWRDAGPGWAQVTAAATPRGR
jgi:phosphohistidine phosphatase